MKNNKKGILANYSRFVVELKHDFHVPLKDCTSLEQAKELCKSYFLPVDKVLDLEA